MKSERRDVLVRLLQAAIQGDGDGLESIVMGYIQKYENEKEKASNDTKNNEEEDAAYDSSSITPAEVLLKLKDGQKRTALHFACQSTVSTTKKRTTTTTTTPTTKMTKVVDNKDEDNDTEEIEEINDEGENNNIDDQEDIVERLLNDEWFPTTRTKMKTTTMISLSTINACKGILKQKDKQGLTPIMLAAQCKDPLLAQRRVRFLLNKADAISKAEEELTVVQTADCRDTGNETTANEKNNKKGGLKLALARSRAGATALHYAAGAGATSSTIHALYDAGPIAINTFSLRGGTPLHWAVAASTSMTDDKEQNKTRDCTSTIDALIECGANVNAQQRIEKINDDNNNDDADVSTGTTTTTIYPPIILAAAAGNDKYCQKLLSYSNDNNNGDEINIDITLPGSITLFHMVAERNLVGTLSMLIQKIKKRNQKQPKRQQEDDGNGHRNDDENENENQPPFIVQEYLQEKLTTEGKTPLHLAAQAGHIDCVKLLLPPKKNDDGSNRIYEPTEEDAKVYITEYNNKKEEDGSNNTNENNDKDKRQRYEADKQISINKSNELKNNVEDDDSKKFVHDKKLDEQGNIKNDDDDDKNGDSNVDSDDDTIENRARKAALELLSKYSSSGNNNDVQESEEMKVKGNALFSKKKYKEAYEYYTKAIQLYPIDATYYSNRSACLLQLQNNENDTEDKTNNKHVNDALYDAIIAKTLKPKWGKVYYRIAMAQLSLLRYENAALSAWEGLQIDTTNVELKKLLQKCVQLGRQNYQTRQQGQQQEQQQEQPSS